MERPVRFPVRFSDLINYFASEAYVPEIHLIIHFDGHIEVPRLQKALRLLLDAEPVLGCRFVESWTKAFWESLSEHELNNAEILKRVSGPLSKQEDAFQSFYAEAIDSFTGPQLKALLFSRQDGDSLVIKINHVTCDAGGFKEMLYRLSSIYNELGRDPNFRPDVRDGSRGLGQVYRNFNPIIRLIILWRGLKELFRAGIPSKSQQYLALKDKRSSLHFKFKHYSHEYTTQLLEYARRYDATLNDLFVTAVFRAIARQSNWDVNKAKAMRINGTVDLRRYLPSGKADALCMLSGVYSVIMKDYVDDGFLETLFKIKAQIDEQKENYLGLGIMLVLYFMLSPYPFFIKKRSVKKQWRENLAKEKVPPGMTNLGPIDNQKVNFGAIAIKNMYMAAPACCPPWFCCGLSGFSGTLTLSSGFYPSSIPVKQIEEFFSLVDEELPIQRYSPSDADGDQ
jgi:NRPS condensation-like uncharacterized protein